MAGCNAKDGSFPADTEVSKEQALLQTYFLNLSKFSFDKAKEIIDKEREVNKAQATLLWSSTLNILNTLAGSEKSFYSLVFLSHNFGSRFFSRKDTLKTMYNCTLTELKKIETAHSSLVPADGSLEQLIGQLAGLLQHFITARIKTIGLYEQMVLIGLGHNRNGNCEDLITVINDIITTCQSAFQHELLNPLSSSFSLECESVKHLVEAQLCMQSCQYMPALLHLYNAHNRLATWSSYLVVRDSKKLAFVGSSPKTSSVALHDWFVKYKNALVSKFSLYFYDVLSKQGQPQEVKAFVSKMSTDFNAKIAAFQKKFDAVNISLIFDARRVKSEPFRGLGYHHPQRYYETKTEQTGYHIMFSYPAEMHECYWQKVCKTCTVRAHELDAFADKPICECAENVQPCDTYLLIRVDPLIILVAIFEMKRAERDTNIINFLSSIASELRCNKVFVALRPGSK